MQVGAGVMISNVFDTREEAEAWLKRWYTDETLYEIVVWTDTEIGQVMYSVFPRKKTRAISIVHDRAATREGISGKMTDTFKFGLGQFETTFVVDDNILPKVQILRGADSTPGTTAISVPLHHIVEFIADRVRKKKISELQMASADNVLGLWK